MSDHAATVQVLTAEVRTLMVGSRQVTLSVFRQLDWVADDEIVPFGRVSDRQTLGRDAQDYGGPPDDIQVVGVAVEPSEHPGTLVRSSLRSQYKMATGELRRHAKADDWSALPLIVLAGLK